MTPVDRQGHQELRALFFSGESWRITERQKSVLDCLGRGLYHYVG